MSDGKKYNFILRSTAMTKTIVKSLLAIIIAVVPLTSCSSDEPDNSKMSGEEFVTHLDTVLTGLSGQILCADES